MAGKHKHQPPYWATRFLHWYCPTILLEEIEGDLYENFYRNLRQKGIKTANLRYIIDVILFYNPVTFRKAKKQNFQHYYTINVTAMFRSFFISAIRNLKKNKVYAAINALGLALGIACCMIIFVIVRYETSFDDYHSKADRIPDHLFKYTFMDDFLNRQYSFLNTIFTFLSIASFLAIFIGCLGLYGLVSFMAVQRTKEIGIRKVLGANVSNIMKMFTKESIVLILIAFVVAAPLAHLAGIALLMEFPERVNPGVDAFLGTLMVSLFIAAATVGYRSFSAAIQSPVNSLRNE